MSMTTKDLASCRQLHTTFMNALRVPTPEEARVIFLTMATAGEAGELANEGKKIWRDGNSPALQKKLRNEAADVYIYLQHLMDELGTNEAEVVAEKVKKLKQRWPDKFLGRPLREDELIVWVAGEPATFKGHFPNYNHVDTRAIPGMIPDEVDGWRFEQDITGKWHGFEEQHN